MIVRLISALLLWLSLGAAAAHAPTPAGDYWPTDGWRTAAPETQGVDSAQLTVIPDFLTGNKFTALNSLIIVRGGYIVYESYYNDYQPTDTDEVRSVTKSVTSALVGIAHERGDLPDVDVTLANVFPQYFADGANADKRDLSLRHLLAMRSGLLWNDDDALSLSGRPDQMERILNFSLVYPPGKQWNYSTADSHLISGVFQTLTGHSLADYADDYLFAPLGISRWEWNTDRQGFSIGGMGLALSPRDMAKFGYLYLNNGMWDGEQIVPADWIAWTTAPQDETVTWYGYQWWRLVDDAGQEKYSGYAARGYAGDNIFVFPELDLVIVTKTRWRVTGYIADQQGDLITRLLDEVIMPAIGDAS